MQSASLDNIVVPEYLDYDFQYHHIKMFFFPFHKEMIYFHLPCCVLHKSPTRGQYVLVNNLLSSARKKTQVKKIKKKKRKEKKKITTHMLAFSYSHVSTEQGYLFMFVLHTTAQIYIKLYLG